MFMSHIYGVFVYPRICSRVLMDVDGLVVVSFQKAWQYSSVLVLSNGQLNLRAIKKVC